MKKPIVIIPAAGKSSRFLGDSPKMLRTHPDGKLMIQKSLETFKEIEIEKYYLITTEDICVKFDLIKKFEQAIPELEVVSLKFQTNSSVETIYEGIKMIKDKIELSNPIFIKDVDNFVEFTIDDLDFEISSSVGVDINEKSVSKISNKSFILVENGFIVDFVEKKIISNFISVGTHYFKNLGEFLVTAGKLLKKYSSIDKELYVSHIVSSNIYDGVEYKFINAQNYLDYGTQEDWESERKRYKTIFCDFDGTLVENVGKYGTRSWRDRNDSPLHNNLKLLKKLYENGAQIIITTSRPTTEKQYIKDFLITFEISIYDIICGLYHSQRILINDFNHTSLYPTASSINLKRNGDLNDYLHDF